MANYVVFEISHHSIPWKVLTLYYNIGPCIKKVFDGENVFDFMESQEHWGASGGKTTLIRVDSSIWQW